MDHLQQARTFLDRAASTDDLGEKSQHLEMAYSLLATAAAVPVQMTWQEEDLLKLIARQGARPGVPISPQTMMVQWGIKPMEDLWAAADSLEQNGLLEKVNNDTAYALTEAGYSLIR